MRAATLLLASTLAACSALDKPSRLDQRAARWQSEADAREARAESDLGAQQQAAARNRAADDALGERQGTQFAAGVAAQQAALARLEPPMRICVLSNARRLASVSTEDTGTIVDAALGACKPDIKAVARTVELAHLSSAGLADELAARLRPEVKRLVISTRARTSPSDGGSRSNAALQP